ncbi:MAG: hypothetical protein ABI759_28745 [Candidatus Solibacter sp.]
MRLRIATILLAMACGAWPQAGVQPGSEPSPMETFAARAGARTGWSSEIARVNRNGTRMVLTALILEDREHPPETMRGVRVDLTTAADQEQIYLDEEAAARTQSALQEIVDMAARRGGPPPNGCFGAKAFWPLYDWPWNKYHELNADYCGSGDTAALVLSGRGSRRSFRIAGGDPADLAAQLGDAIAQLKQH